MRLFRYLPFVLAGLAPAMRAADAPVASDTKPAEEKPLTPAEIARSNELRDLVADEQALYAEFAKSDAKPETALPAPEKERRVKALLKRYETLVADNPDHLESLILYGKFLRRIGDRDLAFKTFLHADRISPNLAVVKHQMAAHLAEDGQASDARPLFLRAIALAPKEARYRYDYGEFLAASTELTGLGGPLSREQRDREMLESFAVAALLKPEEAGYRWRAAEAYYDVAKPDARLALAAWSEIAKDAKSPAEKEVVGLHRAHWLILLGRSSEARPLIRESTSPGLDNTRRKLLDELQQREPGFRDIGTDPTRRPAAK